MDEDLEAGRVPGQLEEAEDSHDGEELEDIRVVFGPVLKEDVRVEAEGRH